MKFAAGIEYDGAPFFGWQRQAEGETVQGALETALSQVANEPIVVTTAGRTDTGVNATGQVVHFETGAIRPMHGWLRGTNTVIHDAVCMTWMVPVDHDFHARYLATGRRYRYIISNRPVTTALHRHRATSVRRKLDAQAMRDGAGYLLGEHDFSAYRAASCQSKSPVRQLRELNVGRSGDWLWIDACADGFLHHMVRNIAGVLIEIGSGEQPAVWARDVLESLDRTRGGVTARPEGLYLAQVDYPERFGLPDPPPLPRFW